MGSALVRGVLEAGWADTDSVVGSDADAKIRKEFSGSTAVRVTDDNSEVAAFADVIVLAVKPNMVATVLDGISNQINPEKLVLSIAAGVPLARIEPRLPPKSRVVRVMPNTPFMAGAGASAFALGTHARPEDADTVQEILASRGIAFRVEEKLLDTVTGLSGSGPAFVCLFIEALADGGVRMGLPRDLALKLAAQTVYGSAKLTIETGLHPAVLKDQVASPGGTTIAGVHALEAGGFRGIVMDAVVEATLRSAELGKEA
jgi:pyrroline-5-carboxylate reductase